MNGEKEKRASVRFVIKTESKQLIDGLELWEWVLKKQ